MEYVQDTVLLKKKKQPVLDIIGFFLPMSTQVKAEVHSTKAVTWIRMWKKKLVFSHYYGVLTLLNQWWENL